jgi:cytochrome b
MMEWHYRSGLTIFGLLLFRLIWGMIGSSTARFSSFLRGPRAIAAYLRGRSPPLLGHNPLGALSVVGLLAMLAVQVSLGLFAADEDGLESGPLAHLVSGETAEELAELHGSTFILLVALIGIHVAAILFYLVVKRNNLVKPMVTGKREAPEGAQPMEHAPAWRFLSAAALAIGAVYWIASGA